jgi:hypothetical protein
MTFTLEIEMGTDGVANRGDLERALQRVASELGHAVSQGFSTIPYESEHILGEQGLIVGKWEVSR